MLLGLGFLGGEAKFYSWVVVVIQPLSIASNNSLSVSPFVRLFT